MLKLFAEHATKCVQSTAVSAQPCRCHVAGCLAHNVKGGCFQLAQMMQKGCLNVLTCYLHACDARRVLCHSVLIFFLCIMENNNNRTLRMFVASQSSHTYVTGCKYILAVCIYIFRNCGNILGIIEAL